MRLHLHPNDPSRLNVEVILSADEAEHWIARLQSGVRHTREGQGDQLLLFGEPARIVVTVRERTPPHEDSERAPGASPWGRPADVRWAVVFGQMGLVFLFLLFLMGLILRFGLLPL